jgi:hypothetical protein
MPRFRKADAITRARVLLLVVVRSAAVGCANMPPTQQRALSGGAIGAGRWPSAQWSEGARRSGPWLAGRQELTPESSGRTSPPRDPVVAHEDPLQL